MPLSILVTYIAGTFLGWLLIKVVRVPPHLHGLVLGCCAAGMFVWTFNVKNVTYMEMWCNKNAFIWVLNETYMSKSNGFWMKSQSY